MKKKLGFALAIVAIVLLSFFAYQTYATHLLKLAIDKHLLKMQDYADVQYQNLSLNALTDKIVIGNLLITPKPNGQPYHIREIVITDLDTENKFPRQLALQINGISVNLAELDAETQRWLKSLAYTDEQLTANISLAYSYQADKKELSVQHLDLGVEKLARITTQLRMGNLDLSSQNAASTLPYTYAAMTLLSAQVRLSDDSLTQHLIDAQAKQLNLSAQEVKTQWISRLRTEMAQDSFGQNTLAAIQIFINNPQHLTLTAQPEKPVSLARIVQTSENKPESLVGLLNLAIEAN